MQGWAIIAFMALASGLALSDGPSDSKRSATGSVRAETTTVPAVPPVLRPSEPADNVVLTLPGPDSDKPRTTRKIVPLTILSPGKISGALPLPPAPLNVADTPAPDASPAAELAGILQARPFPAPLLPPGVPSLPPPPAIPASPRPSAPVIPSFFWEPDLPPPPPPPPPARPAPDPLPRQAVTHPPVPKPPVDAELERESALYCQRRIGKWTLDEARAALGAPVRQRLATDGDQSETGKIFAFKDPTSRYRELELDFDNDSGELRTIFVYPWNMTWQECQHLWGTNVSASQANKGRRFYSYLNRRLDVLVDPAGKVISLGLY